MFKLFILLLALIELAASQHMGSHVQQFGDLSLANKHLDFFMGTSGAGSLRQPKIAARVTKGESSLKQHDADLMYFRRQVNKHPEGSEKHTQAKRALDEFVGKRAEFDLAFKNIRSELEKENFALNEERAPGLPVVDDWDCYMSAIGSFEKHCGKMNEYGLSKVRLFASMCNSGLSSEDINRICSNVCPSRQQ